jgi:hypothetical protein
MPTTVIAERIGWRRSIRVFRDRLGELRPLFVLPVRVSGPRIVLVRSPSSIGGRRQSISHSGFGQWGRVWVVVGVNRFSRFLTAMARGSRLRLGPDST